MLGKRSTRKGGGLLQCLILCTVLRCSGLFSAHSGLPQSGLAFLLSLSLSLSPSLMTPALSLSTSALIPHPPCLPSPAPRVFCFPACTIDPLIHMLLLSPYKSLSHRDTSGVEEKRFLSKKEINSFLAVQ